MSERSFVRLDHQGAKSLSISVIGCIERARSKARSKLIEEFDEELIKFKNKPKWKFWVRKPVHPEKEDWGPWDNTPWKDAEIKHKYWFERANSILKSVEEGHDVYLSFFDMDGMRSFTK